MTTLLEATSGLLRLRDVDGHIVFDSGEKLFQATDRVQGSIAFSATSVTATRTVQNVLNRNTLHTLASVNAACDTVVGAFKVTTAAAYGLDDLGWFNAGGSYIHYINGTVNGAFAAYTFECASGTLSIRERVAMWAQQPPTDGITNTHTMLALTFDFDLYCGSFV